MRFLAGTASSAATAPTTLRSQNRRHDDRDADEYGVVAMSATGDAYLATGQREGRYGTTSRGKIGSQWDYGYSRQFFSKGFGGDNTGLEWQARFINPTWQWASSRILPFSRRTALIQPIEIG